MARTRRRSSTSSQLRRALLGPPGSPLHRRALRAFSAIVLVNVVLPGVVLATVVATLVLAPLPPALPEERVVAGSSASTVLAADGTVIGEFREAELRVPIPAEDIPDTLKDAVVAAEDHEFFSHGGLDVRGIARAFVADVRARGSEQGGSTITQQLVKNLYTTGERTLARKVREAMVAAQVERAMSKDEILARYLNTIYLGDSAFGVEAASQSYFRKPAKELDLSEAALLAGLIPAPSRYSPRRHPQAAEAKRNLVLDAVERYGFAAPEEVAAARAIRPRIHPPVRTVGRFPFFLDYVRTYLLDVAGHSPDLIYRGGLRIETSLDPALQAEAERVVADTLDGPDDPAAALVSLEPQTGFVRALVGGDDWEQSQVNLALGRLGGGSGRQAGSSFKPFVLAQALRAGIAPTRRYRAPASIQPKGFGKPVSNYGGSSYGTVDLRTATWKSINTVYVQLILDAGINETAQLARRLGITSIDPAEAEGGIALGTREVSPLDMASAFGVFATGGLRSSPTPVVRITSPDGERIEDNLRDRGKRVLEEPVADHVTEILEGVLTKGTGTRAKIGRPAAGKTGTTDDNGNAWFVGYTPTLSTAVWMGHPEGNVPMRNIQGFRVVDGGTLPAKIWHDFMVEATANVPVADFGDPGSLDSILDEARRDRSGGFKPGRKRSPTQLPPADPDAGEA